MAIAAMAVAAVVLAGCSSSDDSAGPADWPYSVDDYVAELTRQPDGLTEIMDEGEAECFVGSVVEGIGLDRLAELEVTPEDFAASDSFDGLVPEEEGHLLTVDAMVECADFTEMVLAEADADPEAERCLREEIEERDLVLVFLSAESDTGSDAEVDAAVDRMLQACPDALLGLGFGG